MGSKAGLGLALVGGILYIVTSITTSVRPEVIELIKAFVALQFPGFENTLMTIITWLIALGGIGVILGGIVAYLGYEQGGGYIIILSALGGIISYGSTLYFAYQAGVFQQPYSEIIEYLSGLGIGLLAIILCLLAFVKSRV